ncbi:type I-E CRISPR-associated protein Cse2/CasB [Streptomyces cacaoi]|uniref:type I-E CRISPR-associated protein Cse2/CasB n=1 Tax=Streptomyces cacaoi TaxID=1898 RepID=UPI0037488A1C
MTTEASERGTSPRARYVTFIQEVERLCQAEPGARGDLRNGLRRDIDHRRAQPMHKWLTTRIPERSSRNTVQAYYTVAALIASQPRHSFDAPESEAEADNANKAKDSADKPADYGVSFGRTLGDAAGADALRYSAAESRITLLTRQSVRGIHLHLPSAVQQVRAGGIEVDWVRLLGDLINWPYRSGQITRRWLQDFYMTTFSLEKR